MSQEKKIILSEELENKTQPWVEYLIENYKDPNKFNSCMDVASDNIRMLESLIAQAQSKLRDFKMLKQLTIDRQSKSHANEDQSFPVQ